MEVTDLGHPVLPTLVRKSLPEACAVPRTCCEYSTSTPWFSPIKNLVIEDASTRNKDNKDNNGRRP